LEEGIAALEEERFEYKPVEPSWKTKLAYIWVSRGRWGKPVGFFATLCTAFLIIYFVMEVLPQRNMRAELPNKIISSLSQIESLAKNQSVFETAQQQAASAQRAIDKEDYDNAEYLVQDLESISNRLDAQYDIRVVSRIDENSGVWRVPPDNPDARNFYLIVEALIQNNLVGQKKRGYLEPTFSIDTTGAAITEW